MLSSEAYKSNKFLLCCVRNIYAVYHDGALKSQGSMLNFYEAKLF